MTSTSSPVLLVLGAGPGLGLSLAHRFGAENHAVALMSRSAARHRDYLQSLESAGINAAAFTADVNDPLSLRAAVTAARRRFGHIDVGYYGPADMTSLPGDITQLNATGAESALRSVISAVDFASLLIPELIERGSGGLLFAGGLSSVVPMPPLGGLALSSAALRNYAITLHAALAPAGVYAGTLTIGGLIERGDIYRAMTADPNVFGGATAGTLNPDELANTMWQLYQDRTEAEGIVSTFTN
jgi:NAD(P)-dependent dehydrogenase (short-subunit alcohol dehydrogenase family)